MVTSVTFDDGYADQYTRRVSDPARASRHADLLHQTTGNVGTMNDVTWRDIGIMQRAGMLFGVDSVASYRSLPPLSVARQRVQIDGSLDILRRIWVTGPDAYVYPGGTFHRTTETVLDSARVALASTTDASFRIGAEAVPAAALSRGARHDDGVVGAAIAMPPAIAFSLEASANCRCGRYDRKQRRRNRNRQIRHRDDANRRIVEDGRTQAQASEYHAPAAYRHADAAVQFRAARIFHIEEYRRLRTVEAGQVRGLVRRNSTTFTVRWAAGTSNAS